MLMVIFGAGASADSVPKRDWNAHQDGSDLRPPLATELFQHRLPFAGILKQYRLIPGLIQELRNTVARGEPVEEALQRYAVIADEGDEGTARQLMSLRFYLQDIISSCSQEWLDLSSNVTNYAALLNRIERVRRRKEEPVLLVTFNYDLLLEAARGAVVGQYPDSLDDYVFRRDYVQIKPHGSINWSRLARLPATAPPQQLIEEAGTYQLTDDFILKSSVSYGKAELPAIAVPTVAKSIFECPTEHLEVLKRHLPNVDVLLTIGWRAQEETFLELLAQHMEPERVRGFVVCKNEAETVEPHGRLMAAVPGKLRRSRAEGFSDFLLREKHLDLLLD